MFWLDNRRLFYRNGLQESDVSSAVINPFTNEQEETNGGLDYWAEVQWGAAKPQPAPDWTRVVYFREVAQAGWVITDNEGTTTELMPGIGVGLTVVWKTDSSGFAAFLKEYRQGYGYSFKQRQQPVMVFDLESDQLYTAAYHSGSIIGWRED